MSAGARYRPRRRLRSEILPAAVALAVTAGLAAVFPREAVGFRPAPAPAGGSAAVCAFARLSPDEEERALADARAAWRVNAAGVRRMRADLLSAKLPERAPEPVARLGDRSRVAACEPPAYAPSAIPPGLAAPPPEAIAPGEAAAAEPAFSRDELLRLPSEGAADRRFPVQTKGKDK